MLRELLIFRGGLLGCHQTRFAQCALQGGIEGEGRCFLPREPAQGQVLLGPMYYFRAGGGDEQESQIEMAVLGHVSPCWDHVDVHIQRTWGLGVGLQAGDARFFVGLAAGHGQGV